MRATPPNRSLLASPSLRLALLPLAALAVAGCGPANAGVPGRSDVVELPITGTIYTIVLENHGVGAVLGGANPYLSSLAAEYGTGNAYLVDVHPSLPNYIHMTSGSTAGIGDNGPPAAHSIDGTDNLADQLEAGGITWRAYMDGMGEPCAVEDVGRYAVRHDPFVYYTSLTSDRARCEEHVVDFETHFTDDLAANRFQFMWVTPDVCNDMHDCPTTTTDEWLSRVVPQILASPGYQEGGAIFLLWDEGDADATYAWSVAFHRPQNVPFILISEHLVSRGFVSNTRYAHDSYLATVEDAFGLPRLSTTVHSTPMADFFLADPWGADAATAASPLGI